MEEIQDQIFDFKLEALLKANSELPESERLSTELFILDSTDFEHKLLDAELKIEKECSTLRSEAQEHKRAVHAVLQTFWLDMQQPSRKISGLLAKNLCVPNLPVLKETVEETEEFQKELQRNEMYLSVTKFIAFRPWEVMTDSELVEKQRKSPLDLRSFKRIAEGFDKMLIEAARRRSSGGQSAAAIGSISRMLLGPQDSAAFSLLENCDQVELNLSAYEATKHALLLVRLMRDLRKRFNNEFEALRLERRGQVEKCCALPQSQKETLDVENDVDVEQIINEGVKTAEDESFESEADSSESAGPVEINNKDLKRLEDSLIKFDQRLLTLSKLRLRFKTAITQEQLKVARIKLWILTQSVVFSNEATFRRELKNCSAAVETLTRKHQQRFEKRRRRHERLAAQDAKKLDRPAQQPSVQQHQMSELHTRRSAIQLSATQLRLMDNLDKDCSVPTGQQSPASEAESSDPEDAGSPPDPCKLYSAALKIMDVSEKSGTVDNAAWAAHRRLRRAKVEAEKSKLEVSEMDAEIEVCLTLERNKEKQLKEKLASLLEEKRRLLLDIELQILLPLGQIEVTNLHDPKEIEEAILVPRKVIEQLNQKIKEAGAAKMLALEKSAKFREEKLETAQWHLQKVSLQLLILKDELRHVEKLPITSEIKKYLKGQHLNQQKVKSCQTYEKELVRRRRATLTEQLSELRGQQGKMRVENAELETQIAEVRQLLSQDKCKDENRQNSSENLLVSTKLASEKSRLKRKFKGQEEELTDLREQLEKMRLRTFPTLFSVTY